MMNFTPEMMQEFQNRGGNQQWQGRSRDSSSAGRGMNMRRQQGGGTRDTAAMRRMMNMRNQRGSGQRDTSAGGRTQIRVVQPGS
jgi:hypothetical protein